MPLTGFRQTQTAITVQTYIDEGVSVFKYKTPVLGSPWTVPFEFPAYQISAYVLYKAANIFFSLDLNAALRLTNIIYFYACAFFLFLISKRLFSNSAISKTATLIFLLFPFGIYWSSTSSIEFAADFFSLGYVYFFTLFLDKPAKENFKVFFAALLFGTFGYLTKITTIFPYCIFLAFIIVERFRKTKFSQLSVYIQILALIAVPLIIGIVWTKWTDHIKIISGISALSSQNLQQWNFGTLHQKLSFENWRFIYDSMKKMGINPAVFCAVLLFIPIFLKRKEEFLRALIAIFCSMAAFLVFFNLYYVHDYYYCAILPFLCMFGGYVLYYLISQIQSFFNAESVKKTIAIFCSLALLSIFLYNDPYIKKTFKDAQYFKEYKGKLLTLTGYIKTHSRKSDLIMVFDNDWNSEIPYNAQRKAVMVCWINESSYFKTANDYELFIMNKNSQLKDERIVKLKNIAFEISIGDWDVYRKKK
ncbi:MAG: glycosyltransferase family 39 protein [Endomicrobium sp.]|jgi:hypothetical protein|nr:glycosyltransferase family 39 protein [Endomicrobium sp.]